MSVMMKYAPRARFLACLLTLAPSAAVQAQGPALSPAEIVQAAPQSDWIDIPASDLLVMTLAPDAEGKPRRVVIQLLPPPFSQGWVSNIRALAQARWYDGAVINRVQDNYVVQWGDPHAEDAARARPVPATVRPVPRSDYEASLDAVADAMTRTIAADGLADFSESLASEQKEAARIAELAMAGSRTEKAPNGWHERDAFAPWVEIRQGWPLASDGEHMWPVHCYATVGVGRGMAPDTGTGAELYAVIGHAPRHLDRNVAVVGRVIEGIEQLSTLPRGTGPLGFYEREAQQVPILSIRTASDLPAREQPSFQYLSTESESFARYVNTRANRSDPFFEVPAGGADVCSMPVPTRRKP
ncbi:peptidylprolyl isomerase [Sphingobium lignivorans]|nr:peptidylprolyl isomerase [Sphingobium lignivorans]